MFGRLAWNVALEPLAEMKAGVLAEARRRDSGG